MFLWNHLRCVTLLTVIFSNFESIWLISAAEQSDDGISTNEVPTRSKETTEQRPNIVLIVADDLGWGDVGANWPDTVDTPQLDRLAANGLRLTDFHAGASVCAPSRAALLTGRLGLRTGVVKNFGTDAVGGLPSNETTLAKVLQQAGYRTALLGKWHLGMQPGHHPLDHGFSSYLGVPYSVDMGCADPPGANVPQCPPCHCNETIDSGCPQGDVALPLYLDNTILHQPVKLGKLAHLYSNFAVSFIQNSSRAPFLLVAMLSHIHVPLETAAAFQNITGRGSFADALRETDWLIGQIASAAEEANNTLLWFTSDNGPWEVKCDLAGSRGPFVGEWQQSKEGGGGGSVSKQTVWEAGHRVPSIVHWPGQIKAGSVSSALSSALDVLPTLVALTGTTCPPHRLFDGQDLSHLLLGLSKKGRKMLFHPNSGAAGQEGEIGAVRVGEYKVVYYSGGSPDCSGHAGSIRHFHVPLVFDLGTDTREANPLSIKAEKHKKEVCRAAAALMWLEASLRADNISQVDYSTSRAARPCCDSHSRTCCCPWDS